LKFKEKVKSAVANAAAGSRMLILAPNIGNEVFGSNSDLGKEYPLEKAAHLRHDLQQGALDEWLHDIVAADQLRTARREVGPTWIESTARNYEKIPSFIWECITLSEGEWILAIGPSPKAPRFAVTTQRIFLFKKAQLIHSVDVASITHIEFVS
jgi:hypothetical protein